MEIIMAKEQTVVDSKDSPKFSSSYQRVESISIPLEYGLGHVTCFG